MSATQMPMVLRSFPLPTHFMNRFDWNLSQHYTTVLNLMATALAPSMLVLFTNATYQCLSFFKVTVLAPSRSMINY